MNSNRERFKTILCKHKIILIRPLIVIIVVNMFIKVNACFVRKSIENKNNLKSNNPKAERISHRWVLIIL